MRTGRGRNPDKGTSDRDAYDRALGMLARREYSQRELRVRLEHAGCDEAESESALRKLRDQEYQDDARFGAMIVRARVGRATGPRVSGPNCVRTAWPTPRSARCSMPRKPIGTPWPLRNYARSTARDLPPTMPSAASARPSSCVAVSPPPQLESSPIPRLAIPAIKVPPWFWRVGRLRRLASPSPELFDATA